MALIQGHDFPDDLLYDVENQIWYAPLSDGTLRAGFTSWAVALMGEVLVFTPKRLNHAFEKNRWFAMVEGGKWSVAARASCEMIMIARNEKLVATPELLMSDAYGEGWMLIVRPDKTDWRAGLVTGAAVGQTIEARIAGRSHKETA